MRGRPWTQEELEYLKEHWTDPDCKLAEKIGRPVGSLRTKRRDLGLMGKPHARGIDWSQEEIMTLRELWGEKTTPKIAKAMNRSVSAITNKAKRLGLGAYKDHSDYMPARQVSDLLGVDCHTVTDYWIPKCGLKYKRIAPRGGRKFTCIRLDHLVRWLKQNPDLWDSRRVELLSLGPEDPWLVKKRKADGSKPGRTFQKWTLEEDSRLMAMLRRGGMTREEMGAALGRSESSVGHRVARLQTLRVGQR